MVANIGGWRTHRFIEWGFIGALLLICVVLTTLQNRWTDHLSRATTQQQATQLRSSAQSLCRAFDSELNEACGQLRPRPEQIESLGREQAHIRCLLRWHEGNPRPMFRRLAVVVPEGRQAHLYLLDQKNSLLTPAEWPPEWSKLQANLSRRVNGNQPQPFADPTGLLREYPVFGRRGAGQPGGGRELEWVVMELDAGYLRQTWLPELARRHLNPGKETLNEILVKTTERPPGIVFSTGSAEVRTQQNLVTLFFNSKPFAGNDDPDEEVDQFWTLNTWPRSGEFAAAVSTARAHDFALACVLDGCLLIGGLLIIYYARRARRLSDARMQFVAAVSHELRTPLTVIIAAAQNLNRGIVRDPERVERYSNLILDHSKQLADMVEQVLAFAGAKRHSSKLARVPVEVAQLIRQAITACALDTQATGCEVQTNIEAELPPVLGDARALQRVFQNLLANAAKHGGKGKWIGVSTRYINGTAPGCVEIEVADHGEGIPAREQTHVFEPFFRGSRAQAQQTRGSGIGLSVVQEIVQVHGGSVRVESVVGRGTTFTVSLPAAVREPA